RAEGDDQLMSRPRPTHPDDDRGAVLILVLVLMVIGSLLVLPILSYGSTVLKANSVLTKKTKRQEAVKAGLRIALEDPSELYRHCAGETLGENSFIAMPSGSSRVNGIDTQTTCEFIA